MKYIRTKDTLASVERKEDIELFKQAGQRVVDNIEELCDEFVVWEEDYKIPANCSLKEKERYEQLKRTVLLGMFGGINCWLKLAIWTDKGLIYVAKMNSKGELELL